MSNAGSFGVGLAGSLGVCTAGSFAGYIDSRISPCLKFTSYTSWVFSPLSDPQDRQYRQ